MIDAVVFAAGLATMFAAHQVADHVFGQSDKIAENKTKPGRVGWSHLLQHVFAYHVVMLMMLLISIAILSLPVTLTGLISCLTMSAVSHAIIDRRWPVKWILDNTGSPKFAEMTQPLCGMYLADQGLHWVFLWMSALLLTLG